MKKTKHNKKRNSAFLYECLLRELTKAIIHNKYKTKAFVTSMLKEFFNRKSVLGQELELYKSLYKSDGNLSEKNAEKILKEVMRVYANFVDRNKEEVFKQQSRLIGKVNKNLSSNVFGNFVPNYRNLASISQLFASRNSPKDRVLLEEKVLSQMVLADKKEKELDPISNLTYRTFVEKFNSKYGNLNENQLQLLKTFVYSFRDDGLELKIFLNNEIGNLRNKLNEVQKREEFSDEGTKEKIAGVEGIINGFQKMPINEDMLGQIMKIQTLIEEMTKNESR